MRRLAYLLPMAGLGLAACFGFSDDDMAAYDDAVLAAAPSIAPVYSEVGLMDCRQGEDAPECRSCQMTVATSEFNYLVEAVVYRHVLGRVDGDGRIRASATTELQSELFDHAGDRAGVDGAIADARAWCSEQGSRRMVVLRDVRDTEITNGGAQ